MAGSLLKFLLLGPIEIFIGLAIVGTIDQFLFGELGPPLTAMLLIRVSVYIVLGIVLPLVDRGRVFRAEHLHRQGKGEPVTDWSKNIILILWSIAVTVLIVLSFSYGR